MKIGSYQTLDPRRSRKGKFYIYWKIDKRHKSCKEECAAALSQCSKLELKKIASKKFDAKKNHNLTEFTPIIYQDYYVFIIESYNPRFL